MNRSNKALWLAFAILVPLGMMWEFHPLTDARPRLDQFVRDSARMESRDLPLSAGEQAIFAGVTVVKRLVLIGNARAVVTVIDGTHNRHAVHDPVFCFRGAGWEVSSQETLPLENGEARLLHLRNDKDVADALYWWKTALRRLTFGGSGMEPVLVILTSTSETLPNWPALLKAWPELQAL